MTQTAARSLAAARFDARQLWCRDITLGHPQLLVTRELRDAGGGTCRRRCDEAAARAKNADGGFEVSGIRVGGVEGDATTRGAREWNAGGDLENGDPVTRRDGRPRVQHYDVRGYDAPQERRG